MGYRSQVKSVVYQTNNKFVKFANDYVDEIEYLTQEFSVRYATKGDYKVL